MPTMERSSPRVDPDILRKFAKQLEDKRQMVNVERCKYIPELNQDLLLALNGATGKNSKYKEGFPDAGAIANLIKKRLIKVSTSDKQSAILGLFFTTIDPLKTGPLDPIKRTPNVAIGIFPLYNDEIKYIIRPLMVDEYEWRTSGKASIVQESALREDPFLIANQKELSLLYFKKSPFRPGHPYEIKWSKVNWEMMSYPQSYNLSLEENVINHALHYLKNNRRKPDLFKKTGFRTFINSHCSDPKYVELHAAFTQFMPQKDPAASQGQTLEPQDHPYFFKSNLSGTKRN
jgi:hypothetical protein